MKLPESIKIGHRRFTLEGKNAREMDGLHGQAHYARSLITIVWADEDQIRKNTLLHEILHCISIEYEIQQKDKEADERSISCMTNGLMQVIIDNPQLLDIFSTEKKYDK